MAETARVGNLVLVGMFIVVAAATAQGDQGTINYRLAIDDILAPNHVKAPGTIKVTIQANVPDLPLTGGGYGGVIQYAVNLLDSTGTGSGSSLLPQGTTYWGYTVPTPLVKMSGTMDSLGYDVLDLVGGVPYGEEETYKSLVGAGPDVWTSVGYGYFTYTSGTVVLSLVPRPLEAQLVWGDSGMEFPAGANGYSTTLTPEPATLALLGLGGLGLLVRRRRPGRQTDRRPGRA